MGGRWEVLGAESEQRLHEEVEKEKAASNGRAISSLSSFGGRAPDEDDGGGGGDVLLLALLLLLADERDLMMQKIPIRTKNGEVSTSKN